MKIKTVAVTDTNVDPDPIDYPIPGNDDSASSIEYFLKEIIGAYSNSYLKAQEAEVKEAKKNSK